MGVRFLAQGQQLMELGIEPGTLRLPGQCSDHSTASLPVSICCIANTFGIEISYKRIFKLHICECCQSHDVTMYMTLLDNLMPRELRGACVQMFCL